MTRNDPGPADIPTQDPTSPLRGRRSPRAKRKLALAMVSLALVMIAGCSIGDLIDSLDSKYYHISGGNGVYLTIKRHATGCMVWSWFNCVASGKSEAICGRDTLRVAKDMVTNTVPAGRPRDLWNGDYSIFGYHPRFKNAFEDDEASDFVQAIHDMGSRGDECLRVHWKPTGENWTTLDDEGFAECSWGERVKLPGTPLSCSSLESPDLATRRLVALLGDEFRWKATPSLSVFQLAEVYPRLDDPSDTLFHVEAGVRQSLTDHLFLEVAVVDDYDTEPAPDREKNDLRYLGQVGYQF